jgi:hypothetical protein
VTVSDDNDRRLALVGSENRAQVLVDILDHTDDAGEARDLLAEWFNVCDALAPYRHDLRRHLERVHAAGLTIGGPADTPCVVFRGAWEDDDAASALSWTTSLDVAQRFARGLTGMRAQFLGIRREGVNALVFRGVCLDAYGALDDREEQEVVARTVRSVEPIQKLVTQPRDVLGS